MSVASRLAEAGHYASTQIKQISGQLDQDWKSFAAALDERSTILAMSSVFHQKAEQVSKVKTAPLTVAAVAWLLIWQPSDSATPVYDVKCKWDVF